MRILCVTGYGKTVRRQGDLLSIESSCDEPESGETITVTPLDLELVVISGDHAITTAALRSLLSNNTEVVLLDPLGNPAGFLLPCAKSPMIEAYERQKSLPSERMLEISRSIVAGAIGNKIGLLRRLEKGRGIDLSATISSLACLMEEARCASSVASLLGVEGFAGRTYFDALRRTIPDSFGFQGRQQHPPTDPVNSLLSYGYGMLYARVRTAIVKARLNPFYGILHRAYRNQEALVYDLIEEFRQPIVDRTVLTLLNRNEIKPEQFSIKEGMCMMNDPVRRLLVSRILERCEQPVEWAGREMKISEVIEFQAEQLSSAIMKGTLYRSFEYR